jgi:hypothetical protein
LKRVLRSNYTSIQNNSASKNFFEISNLVYLRDEKTFENRIQYDNTVNIRSNQLCKNDLIFTSRNSENFNNFNHKLYQVYNLKDENDTTLLFESRFESGNLLAASKISENEYQLLLSCDTNTVGYSQWFFFRVSNIKKNKSVKFNILNQVSK